MYPADRSHPPVLLPLLRRHRAARRLFSGSVLMLLGVGYLLVQQGLLARHDLWLLGPAALALSGLLRLLLLPGALSAVHAVVRCAIAAYLVLVIEHVGGWTFRDTWPVLLIAVGLVHIGRAVFDRRLREEPNW